ncbi:MAG: protein GlmU [Desulfosudaceae bacterium]
MKRRPDKTEALISKGVVIPSPDSIEIGEDVDIENISGKQVEIHAGSRIHGRSTLICSGAVIGSEGPATVNSCQVGNSVRLGGGFFEKAVFLNGARAGANTHARQGSILEEEASLAHTVGIKQTILFPFVTLGSLINFCDCLMSGGTGPKNHSEVGSSYVHFNFSVNQDKATPSLFGDVARGVMLRENPIFLGGQGGAVGPLRLAFGTVTAAGTICRKDELIGGKLVVGKTIKGGSIPYPAGRYDNINRIVASNINYVANLVALSRWYEQVRGLFVNEKNFPEALLTGLKNNLNRCIEERLIRLEELADKMPEEAGPTPSGQNDLPPLIHQKNELYDKKEVVVELLRLRSKTESGDSRVKDDFLEIMSEKINSAGRDYLTAIRSLDETEAKTGTVWLRSIIDNLIDQINDLLPSFYLMSG